VIVFAGVNDENSLRTYGSKTNAYAVFEKLLENGNPPNGLDTLLAEARPLVAEKFLGSAKVQPPSKD